MLLDSLSSSLTSDAGVYKQMLAFVQNGELTGNWRGTA